MPRFREGLETVLTAYPTAQGEALTNHPLARLLMHGLPELLSVSVEGSSYIVVGSPGRGNWAETPSVAIFDPLVTDSAQRGFYVVYLLRGDGTAVYVSLGQATTEAVAEHGSAYRGTSRLKLAHTPPCCRRVPYRGLRGGRLTSVGGAD